jgi:hypothetical protein
MVLMASCNEMFTVFAPTGLINGLYCFPRVYTRNYKQSYILGMQDIHTLPSQLFKGAKIPQTMFLSFRNSNINFSSLTKDGYFYIKLDNVDTNGADLVSTCTCTVHTKINIFHSNPHLGDTHEICVLFHCFTFQEK